MWAAMDRWSGVSVAMRVAPAELPNDAAAHFRPGCPLRGRILFTILAGLLLSQSLGCVHRRMTIRSDPPGALVLLEGEEIGYTPVSVDFTYYGTREITLIKDGYQTLTALRKIPAPWYQKVPFDFVTDNLSPVPITDRHEISFTLQPQVIVSNQELLERAKGLRSESQISP